MKTRKLPAVLAALAFSLVCRGAETNETAYVMVYHEDADHSLHIAWSLDSYNYFAVNGDRPVVDGREVAMQKGIRDPFIARAPDGTFVVVATDLHVFGKERGFRATQWERDDAKYDWGNNRGIVIFTSRNLVDWRHRNIDFTKLECKTGEKDAAGRDIPWSEAGCVWAPELVWDERTDSFFMHFTTRFGKGRNLIYAAHLKSDFSGLAEEPFLLYSAPRDESGRPRYNIIDSDIVRGDDGTWHLFYVSHERGAAIRHATGPDMKGSFADAPYFDGEKRGHEAPNAWRRPDGTWVVMWDSFSMNPHNFGFTETKDFKSWRPIGYFDAPSSPMKRHGFAGQKHGSVLAVPREAIRALEE